MELKRKQMRMERIAGVHDEFLAARVAMSLLEAQLHDDPNRFRDQGVRVRVAREARNQLEATYLIRLFAEFEAGLRDCWRHGLRQTTTPPMKDLMAAFTSRREIPQGWHDDAEIVRNYRNALVHPGLVVSEVVTIAQSRERLCRFFSRLPIDWSIPESSKN